MSITEAELEIANLIVSTIDLEVEPDRIDPEAPLCYEGLGHDSLDALEIAMEISRKYGFELRSDDEKNGNIFASLRSLTKHVLENRAG